MLALGFVPDCTRSFFFETLRLFSSDDKRSQIDDTVTTTLLLSSSLVFSVHPLNVVSTSQPFS